MQTLGVLNFRTLFTQAVMFGQHFQASTYFSAMQCSAHRQSIKPTFGPESEDPVQNRSVDRSVVCKGKGIPPVILGKELVHGFSIAAKPDGRSVIFLHRHADYLELRATHVLLSGNFC